jgi:hydroxymethylbilane synthase
MPSGLTLAGFLPREDPRDTLVRRAEISTPRKIATGSPRRRAQGSKLFKDVEWSELRGNVDTRLRKVAEGQADATFLAQAGLNRLGIHAWEGLVFETMTLSQMVPAAGQGAIALQTRADEAGLYASALDAATARAVGIERLFLARLGEGCHTAFACHVSGENVSIYRDDFGRHDFPMLAKNVNEAESAVTQILSKIKS